MQLLVLRLASTIAISFVYMLFDIFNKRNVPGSFAYLTLGYGFVLTLLYLDVGSVLASTAIALVILGIGYLVYRMGQIGAADIIELAAISLMLPMQPMPVLLSGVNQFWLPFVVSVMVAAGIVAMIIVPMYYLPRAKSIFKRPLTAFIDKKGAFKAVMIIVPYMAFALFLVAEASINAIGLAILLAMTLGSSMLMLFEKPITDSMVEFITINGCDEGDIIAFNLMKKKEVDAIRKRVAKFDRLLTRDLIAQMKAKHVRNRLPVYRKALPFALPIFAGVVMSILLGNMIFFILPVV